MAYEAGVASGYGGTRDEWMSSEVSARYNRSGDVVVSMPGGEDFTVVVKKDNASDSKSGYQAVQGGKVGEAGTSANAAGAGAS